MTKLHLIMPMGGKGSRFSKYGFDFPKPLIDIQGKPFFYWATQSIVKFVDVEDIIFVVLQEHIDKFQIDEKIKEFYPDAKIQVIKEVLNGAVLTCMEGMKAVNDDLPVLFNDCDHIFKCDSFNEYANHDCMLESGHDLDGALLTFTSDSPAYSYCEMNEAGLVINTVEKQVVSNQAICGCYYFRSKDTFMKYATEYLDKCAYTEYFVSGVYNCMAADKQVIAPFECDYHIPFGIPEEYEAAKDSAKFGELI